jgi:hypothetical protein
VCDDIEDHIAAVEAFYRPLITGSGSRLEVTLAEPLFMSGTVFYEPNTNRPFR